MLSLLAGTAAIDVAGLLMLHLPFRTALALDLARLLMLHLLTSLSALSLLTLRATHLLALDTLHLWGTHLHPLSAAVALTAAARLLHGLTATAVTTATTAAWLLLLHGLTTAVATATTAAMALTAAALWRRRRSAAAIAFAISAATTVATTWPRACRGRDRQRGYAGCEKHPGQHR